MSHLEDLLCEYYDWQGYIVRRNVKVGRLSHGGWEGELDIVAYHPKTRDLVHLEPSIDALPSTPFPGQNDSHGSRGSSRWVPSTSSPRSYRGWTPGPRLSR